MSDSIHELLALVLEQQQVLQHQVLLNNAVFAEFVEESSRQFDEMYYLLEALKSKRQGDDLDELIENEKLAHLKRQMLILSKHLHKLQERQAQYGLEAPPHIEIQIEEYQDKLAAISEEIKNWTS